MDVEPNRYDRNERLFGAEGQAKLRGASVVVVGAGGLGSALIPHLALLGVGRIVTVDDDDLDHTSRNRLFGARDTDPVPGSAKVTIADRLICETNPQVISVPIYSHLVTPQAFAAVRQADWVFGCFDHDGPRSLLNELCSAYAKPYIDLASDVPSPGIYGGRVVVATGKGCLHCLNQLDARDVRRFFEPDAQLEVEDRIYGIPKRALAGRGPAVSPINGVVASLAATEFMVAATGMRAPTTLAEYRAWESKVVVSRDQPREGCPVCQGMWNQQETAEVERYLALPHLVRRRND